MTTRRSASENMRMAAGEASQPPRDIKETVKAMRQAVQVHTWKLFQHTKINIK
jgi:hypothetical protein